MSNIKNCFKNSRAKQISNNKDLLDLTFEQDKLKILEKEEIKKKDKYEFNNEITYYYDLDNLIILNGRITKKYSSIDFDLESNFGNFKVYEPSFLKNEIKDFNKYFNTFKLNQFNSILKIGDVIKVKGYLCLKDISEKSKSLSKFLKSSYGILINDIRILSPCFEPDIFKFNNISVNNELEFNKISNDIIKHLELNDYKQFYFNSSNRNDIYKKLIVSGQRKFFDFKSGKINIFDYYSNYENALEISKNILKDKLNYSKFTEIKFDTISYDILKCSSLSENFVDKLEEYLTENKLEIKKTIKQNINQLLDIYLSDKNLTIIKNFPYFYDEYKLQSDSFTESFKIYIKNKIISDGGTYEFDLLNPENSFSKNSEQILLYGFPTSFRLCFNINNLI